MTARPGDRRDYFISYAGADRDWAIWVATQLEGAGLTVELDEWDWPPGSDAIVQMSTALERADRVLALWSPSYFDPKSWAGKELSAAMYQAHRRQAGRLIPVVVRAVEPPPLFGPLVAIRLDGLPEVQASALLISRLSDPRKGTPNANSGAGQQASVAAHYDSSSLYPGHAQSAVAPTPLSTAPLAVLPASNFPLLAGPFVGRDNELGRMPEAHPRRRLSLAHYLGNRRIGKNSPRPSTGRRAS